MKIMYFHKTKKWYDKLQIACNILNSRINPRLGLAPKDIDYDNDNEIYRQLKLKQAKPSPKEIKKAYRKGDFVRLRLFDKDLSYKGYNVKWTSEIFRISQITTWKTPIKYRLKDLNGAPVGIYSYYKQELLKVNANTIDNGGS